jgi:NADPH:quinone reductase-like Zn-dependent oxidoreductase
VKAVIYTEYGPPEVLKLKEIERPMPKEKEILIRVHAVAATTGDSNSRGFTFVPPGFGPLPRLMFGLRKPRKQILGLNISGEVVSIGEKVTQYKVGDQVFGSTGSVFGGYAEYVSLPEDAVLAPKPNEVSYEEACTYAFGAQTALYFLRNLGKVTSGQRVLINGASGSVGTFAVQLAKYYGAHVTGVCSAEKHGLLRSLGADTVIDYTKEDFTKNGESYNVILDVIGKIPFPQLKDSLAQDGLFLAVEAGLGEFARALWTSITGGKKVKVGVGLANKKDMLFLKKLMETGKIRSVIDTVYTLEKIVDAHKHVDSGHKKGDVVIRIEHRPAKKKEGRVF